MFDVEIYFTRKARGVKDGHQNPDPETSSYDGVLIRESIRILFLYEALHEFDVMAADIRNSCIQAPTSENHIIIFDADFHGIENGSKQDMVVKALYGGKLAGRYLWMHLCACMDNMGFASCFVEPYVWIRN